MRKVMLITCSIEEDSGLPKTGEVDDSHYPLGLAYIHSYLEKLGHVVDTLFLNPYSYQECFGIVQNKLEELKPDVVGVQILTFNRVSSFKIIEYIHTKYPQIKIIIGGIHTTVMYEQILNKYHYLIAILGEGEITFGELLEGLENACEIGKINGIAFFKEGAIIRTEHRELIADLDILPFPKHEIFFKNKRTMAALLTTRGCPNKCNFCVLEAISERKVRYRSVKNVVDEIEYLYNSYPYLKLIWIHDDSFFLNNRRVIDICNEIIRRKIKLQFVCSARFKPVSKEVAAALENAGFVKVIFGLESGSPRVLRLAHKNITQDDATNAVSLFRKSPIEVVCLLIVGLPGEDLETIVETATLVQKLQKIKYMYYTEVVILMVYPGTEVHEIAKSHGTIDDNYWLTEKPVPYFTAEHSEKTLNEYRNILYTYISLEKFFTIGGLRRQTNMVLTILKYVIVPKNALFVLRVNLGKHLRKYPKLFARLKQIKDGLVKVNKF